MNDPYQRRNFLRTTGVAAAATLANTPQRARSAEGASDRIVVGIIGPGGMGLNHTKAFASYKDVRVAYVCDVDAQRLARAGAEVEKISGTKAKQVSDMRRILDDAEVDAVVIATPDHWHAPATVLACDAGKHVYVEKPCSHNIREGRLMIEAARRNKKVVQVGTQSRSTKHVREAMEKLHGGAIGEVLVAKAWNSQRRSSIGKTKPSVPPAHLDFDTWLGPAPPVPYRTNMLPSIWRWWYDFGCGDMGNDGVHDLDIALWGLGVESHPTRVAAMGGKYFFDDDQQFPDTQNVLFEYAPDEKTGRRRQLIFEQRIWAPYHEHGYENGDAYYGTDGYMILGKGGGWRLYGQRDKLIEERKASGVELGAHHRNFLDCVRAGGKPNADIAIGHQSATLCHLGNIAVRVGRSFEFDPDKEIIIGDDEANALVRRQYREHWATPAI